MDTELASVWSTCVRLQVATTITDRDFVTVLTARNGVPIDKKHCNEYTDDEIDRAQRCFLCIHSERNAINQAAKLGVKLQGLNLFTLYRPCVGCANDLVQVQIGGLYYRHDYDSDGQKDYVLDMFKEVGTYVVQLEMTPEEVTFSKMLLEWKKTWQ